MIWKSILLLFLHVCFIFFHNFIEHCSYFIMTKQKIKYVFFKNLVAILLFGFCNSLCLAQDNSFKFRRLTIDDGLSQSSVPSIAQDKEGYIWFATANGLNRFNGYEFLIFKNEIDNDSSLSDNRVEKLFFDSKERLWVGTDGGGLNLFNYISGSFKRIHLTPDESLNVKAIYEGRNGVIWIGTRNGFLYKIEQLQNDSLLITSHPVIIGKSQIKNDINDITFYHNRFLIGTAGRGIICFDPESERFSEFDMGSSSELLNGCVINAFYIDKQQNLWIATDDLGMFVHYENLENIIHFEYENYGSNGLLCNNICTVTEDSIGYLWVGTKAGLNVSKKKITDYKNPGELSFTSHIFSASNQKSLSNNFVLSIFEDRSGLVWIGTSAGGVNLFNRSTESFNYFQKIEGLPNSLENEIIMSVYDDNNDVLWIGSDAGLIKFDKRKKIFKNYWNEVADQSFKYNTIMSVTELENEQLLLGTFGGGLVIFDKVKEQFTSLVNDAYDALSLNQRILTTYKDSHGDIWVGTDGDGIVKFRYNINIQKIRFTQYKHIQDAPNSLSHNDVWKFFEDDQAKFWIGTAGGLNQYHPGDEKFTHYTRIPNNSESLSSNRIYCMTTLDSARLLIGTDNGLNIFNKNTGKFEYFTEKEGLPNHVIYGILEEGNNFFWLSTNNGISRFDITNKTFKNYSTTDGLPSNEFNAGAYFKNAKGELFFGSTKGLLWFDPFALRIFTNQFIPPVVISGIEVKGMGKADNPNTEKGLNLKYDQNTVTFSFAALDYASPSKNQYAYKLDQLGKDWTFIGNRRFVTFSNLRPGKYDFSVKGSNNDGVWNETPVTLQFVVLPPWWQTWWALSLYGILALGIIVSLRHYEMKRLRLQQKAAHLAELNMFKSRFYTNITHEFRTPLTVIMGMAGAIQANIGNKHPDRTEESLKMIQRNSENLLRLVNQMLDLAKLESGSLQLQLVQADIIPFVKYVCESFQSLAREKHINLTVYAEIDKLITDFDPDKFSVVVSNLLSNAIKFTQPNGKIIVHINRITENKTESFIVKVIDNGPGISEKVLPNIFDRFYQADTSASGRGDGSGIGLSLTKELVELMKGAIEVKSKPGKGSEFIVRLPVNRNAQKVSEVYPAVQMQSTVLQNEMKYPEPPSVNNDDLPVVLIVEDNADVAHYLKSCLSGRYQTLHAGDGISGIKMAFEKIPDIVICDVMMPGKSGFEVCSTLKSDERTDHIPIILLTAKATQEDRLAGLNYGADAYLTKPFVKAELFTRLDQLVQLRKKMLQKFENDGFANILAKRTANPETKFLQNVIRIIHDDMSNDFFGSKHLSHSLQLSESQLYRKLKAVTGKSTAVFIRSVRLQKAKELILTSEKTIAEVAYEVGFNDPSWFSRAFREEFGFAPNETRKH